MDTGCGAGLVNSGPADPFPPLEAGAVAMVMFYRAARKGGAGMIEAAFIVAANIAVNSAMERENPGSTMPPTPPAAE